MAVVQPGRRGQCRPPYRINLTRPTRPHSPPPHHTRPHAQSPVSRRTDYSLAPRPATPIPQPAPCPTPRTILRPTGQSEQLGSTPCVVHKKFSILFVQSVLYCYQRAPDRANPGKTQKKYANVYAGRDAIYQTIRGQRGWGWPLEIHTHFMRNRLI